MLYTTADGNGAADQQTLMMGDEIQEAIISHTIPVAENTSGNLYMKFKPQNHSYYTVDDGTYIVETESGSESPCRANSLPRHLTGWQTSNGTPFTWSGSDVDQTFIDTFYDGGAETNLNLYAVWGDTKYLRVIISTFNTSQVVNTGTYNVSVVDTASYGPATNDFKLSPLFKETVDYSNRAKHLLLKFNGFEDSQYREVGTGHGCPKSIGGTKYPTYFGFKSGNTLTVGITIANANFIPNYYLTGSTINYVGYLCNEGLSRDLYDKGASIPLSVSNNVVWTGTITTPTSDKTLFVPLVPKPTVTITVHPTGSGTVTGGGQFMPGDTCTLNPIPAQYYELDEIYVNGVSLASPYQFTVLGNTNVIAYFALGEVSTLYYSYYCYNGTESFEVDTYVWHQNSNNEVSSRVYCTSTPQSINYGDGTIRVFEAAKVAYTRPSSQLVANQFMGFKSYTGSTRNPLTDTDVPYVDSGGSTVRAQITVSGTVKIYAYYSRA